MRPFDTPLIVAIGYAAFGLTSSLGRAGVAEVAALTNGLRPAVEPRSAAYPSDFSSFSVSSAVSK